MSLISNLLTLPVSGPFRGVGWVLGKIAESAEREYYNPAAVKALLTELENRLDKGDISEDEYEAEEARLLDRLQEIRDYNKRNGNQT